MNNVKNKDEAKKFVLEARNGEVFMENQELNVSLKNELEHRHLDLEFLVAKTKHEAAFMKVKSQADIATKLVEYYENNMHAELVLFLYIF